MSVLCYAIARHMEMAFFKLRKEVLSPHTSCTGTQLRLNLLFTSFCCLMINTPACCTWSIPLLTLCESHNTWLWQEDEAAKQRHAEEEQQQQEEAQRREAERRREVSVICLCCRRHSELVFYSMTKGGPSHRYATLQQSVFKSAQQMHVHAAACAH